MAPVEEPAGKAERTLEMSQTLTANLPWAPNRQEAELVADEPRKHGIRRKNPALDLTLLSPR